jgi:hypothetical protein
MSHPFAWRRVNWHVALRNALPEFRRNSGGFTDVGKGTTSERASETSAHCRNSACGKSPVPRPETTARLYFRAVGIGLLAHLQRLFASVALYQGGRHAKQSGNQVRSHCSRPCGDHGGIRRWRTGGCIAEWARDGRLGGARSDAGPGEPEGFSSQHPRPVESPPEIERRRTTPRWLAELGQLAAGLG